MIVQCKWVKNPYIKTTRCWSHPQKCSATISERAPSSLFADLCATLSPVTGCTCVGRVQCQLCDIICQKFSSDISDLVVPNWRKSHQEQLRACSIVNFWSQIQREGSSQGANCISNTKHPERHLYVEWIHDQQLEEWWARLKHLFWWRFCSAQFANLHNFEIVLSKLETVTLLTNFEIAQTLLHILEIVQEPGQK